jgi:hypothetical protein
MLLKKMKCKECGKEFILKPSVRFIRKFCDDCSKKRKQEYQNLYRIKYEECDDD